MKFASIAFSVLAALGLGACSESTGTSNAVTVSGTVTEVLPGDPTAGDPVADVEVCQFGSNNCTVTDDDGVYELRVLKNRNLAMSFLKEGYGPVLVASRPTVIDYTLDAGLPTADTLTDFFNALDASPPDASGYLTATTFQNEAPLPGVSYGLTGSSGTSFYFGDDGEPDTSLSETRSAGSGGFIDIAPVTVDLSVTGAVNCTAENSWRAPAVNTFQLPIRLGFWTQTRVDCE